MNTYDALARTDVYRQVNDTLLGLVDVPRDAVAVDVGCGTGFFAEALLRDGRAGRVVALDPDERMVAVARAALGPRASVVQAGAERLEAVVEPGSVDLVLLGNCIHLLPDVAGFLRLAFAALRPGGQILFNSTFIDDGADPADRQVYWELLLKARQYLREKQGASVAAHVRPAAKRSITAQGYRAMLTACGFEAVELREQWAVLEAGWIESLVSTPVFATGALPQVPEADAIAALRYAVDQIAAQTAGARIRRKWIFMSARKPQQSDDQDDE